MSGQACTHLRCDADGCEANLLIPGGLAHARVLAEALHGWGKRMDPLGGHADLCGDHYAEHLAAREAARTRLETERRKGLAAVATLTHESWHVR